MLSYLLLGRVKVGFPGSPAKVAINSQKKQPNFWKKPTRDSQKLQPKLYNLRWCRNMCCWGEREYGMGWPETILVQGSAHVIRFPMHVSDHVWYMKKLSKGLKKSNSSDIRDIQVQFREGLQYCFVGSNCIITTSSFVL